MYQVNDLIMYGTTGVYRIASIGKPEMSGADKDKLYYELKPLYGDGRTYAPVDTNTYTRPVISSEKAQELIDLIPSIEAGVNVGSLRVVEDNYKASLNSHDCTDLIRIIKAVREKGRIASSRGKNICQIDQRYKKKAEDLLYGEFSAALDIPRDAVEGYIEERVGELDNI